jgi:hypothetical protein
MCILGGKILAAALEMLMRERDIRKNVQYAMNLDELIIRSMETHDVDKVVELLRVIWEIKGEPVDVEDLTRELRHYQACYLKSICLVGEINSEIVAFGIAMESPMTHRGYEFLWGGTHPQYQGKGIGTKLNKERISWVKSVALPNSVIMACSEKPSMYRREGFKTVLEMPWDNCELMVLHLD